MTSSEEHNPPHSGETPDDDAAVKGGPEPAGEPSNQQAL